MWSLDKVSHVITFASGAAVIGVVFGAAALQRATGFGFALLAVPLLAFVVPTKSAVIVVFLVGSLTSAWLTVRLASKADWRIVRTLGAGAIVGAPFGVIILHVVSTTTLRFILGVSTCVAAFWIITSSRRRRSAPPVSRRARTFGIGVSSGILNTSLATNGPPLVYELRRTGFRDDRFRATISAVFLISNVIGLPLLAGSGLISTYDVGVAAMSVVPCALGIAVGAWIGARMETAHFVWAVDLLLLVTGVLTIVRALA